MTQAGTSTSPSRQFGKLWPTQLASVPMLRQQRANWVLHVGVPLLTPGLQVQSILLSVHDQPAHSHMSEEG